MARIVDQWLMKVSEKLEDMDYQQTTAKDNWLFFADKTLFLFKINEHRITCFLYPFHNPAC